MVIAAVVVMAAVVNLLVFVVGRALGGSFEFTSNGVVNQVDALTVVGFSAVPLLIGLVVVVLLVRFGDWVTRTATIVAPVLAVVTILVMTLPADLDGASTIALSLCHVTLAPISVAAVRALGRLPRIRAGESSGPAELRGAQNGV
ncbi:DUF6069 family protein [Paractinoplanes lichenicola]|nr:DUF6069 family protein [Actinoplanes lichenicola]